MSNKDMQARVRPLQSYDSESFIVMRTNFDSSSKLYFEEKSNNVLCDNIFKKVVSLFLQVQSWFLWPNALSCNPYKECRKISSF